ncbi:SDR family NAD(P)-dependent oxidoreductase [Humibacillus xanthopallidus]|uniref:NAD(P)-dependent dehydrogenase (Short-subunit alcohol dehydrogenase family) n=1 Tax=Humibacillus xanthopallidus TaxID=412689 RepID=A0A543HU83_9MICO|nr:SDR family NAD(P)-dependent oxidoreductase [Humibacillus xanthopallidus]TQM61860.1 NAD(P)-dependent dehydrogenase (short-subunit alcohol dehydrogenase family) [Humibacillus xanthopallidus]
MAKTVLLTGGGRGLGRVTAEKLAVAGHRVLLTARTGIAAQTAVDQIHHGRSHLRVEPRAVDLSSLEQVRAFATAEAARGDAIDVLFHVAGIMQTSKTRRLTVDGYEETLAVNALAPFLLTALLRPALELAPAARVITVSSRLHLPDSRGAPVDFDFDDPQLQRGYNPDRAYKNSKLAVLWFTYELQRRLSGTSITANAICPGFVPTTAAASTTGPMRLLMSFVMPHMPFATSVADATDSFVFMALDPSIDGVGGAFYGERHPIESSPQSHDIQQARRFWRLADQLTGLT